MLTTIRRHRWSALIGVAVVVLAVAWTVWAAVARRRLAAARAALVAAGEPVDVADLFLSPPIPAGRNAADLYLAAIAALSPKVDSPTNSNVTFTTAPPAWLAMADAAVAADGPALALAHQARFRPDVDWHLRAASPPSMVLLAHVNGSRTLANLLADTALAEHLHGDDGAAFERVQDGLALAVAIDRGTPSFDVEYLVAAREYSTALQSLQVIAIDARIGDGPGAVRRSCVEAWVRRLSTAGPDPAGLHCAVANERVVACDTVQRLGSRLVVLRPMLDLELARILDKAAGLLGVVGQPDLPAAVAALTAVSAGPPTVFKTLPFWVPGFDPTPRRYSHLLGEFAASIPCSSAHLLTTDFRLRAELAITATFFALRLYHLDHGRWPAALSDVVPAYLPAVPVDPVFGGGRPLRYVVQPRALPGGGDRVLLDWDPPASGTLPPPPTAPASAYAEPYGSQPHYRDVVSWTPPTPSTAPTKP